PQASNDMSLFASSTSFPDQRMFVMTDLLGDLGVGIVPSGGISTTTGPLGIIATIRIDVSASLDGGYSNSLNPSGAFPTGLTSPTRGGVLGGRGCFLTDGRPVSPPPCAS